MGRLIIDTSVTSFYRRSLTPADSEIEAEGLNPEPALDTNRVKLLEGEWVTLDSDGKAVKTGATASGYHLAFPVWVGQRSDAGAALKITAIQGVYNGKTTVFDSGVAYTPGMPLKTVNGELTEADTSGDRIIAFAEGPAAGATTQYPDGFLPFTTQNAGGYLP